MDVSASGRVPILEFHSEAPRRYTCSATAMQIAVELSEDIAEILKVAWSDLPHGVLEAVAVEGNPAEY